MDCFGTAVSMSLQYGVPLEVYVNKFSHTRFEPMGHTKNPDIRIAKSIVDYIFRWLGIQFLPGYREANKGLPAEELLRRRKAMTRGVQRFGVQGSPPEGRPMASAVLPRNAQRPSRNRRTLAKTPRRPRPPPTANTAHPTATAKDTGIVRRQRRLAGPRRRGDVHRSEFRHRGPRGAVRQFPARRPQLRQLRRDHRPQRQLLSVPQLRQQHGLLVDGAELRATSSYAKEAMTVYQASRQGGIVYVEIRGDLLILGGDAVIVAESKLFALQRDAQLSEFNDCACAVWPT